jgi:hypothetical protein
MDGWMDGWMEREREMAKMTIAFHNFANAPKIEETLLDVSKKAGL